MKYGNLHLHSRYSDAQFAPSQLVVIGKALGYKALALTDHETDGGVKSFMASIKHQGMEAFSGIEFYGRYNNENLHIVALDYDMDNPALRAYVQDRVERRAEYTRKCFERGVEIGYITEFTWDDIVKYSPENAWMGYDTLYNIYTDFFVPFKSDFRQVVFNSPEARKFAYKAPDVDKVIKIIRDAGGVAILAHPYRWTQYVPALVDMGLNGIEVSHPDNIENTGALAKEAAKAYNLYVSGGTDHTGPMSGCDGNLAIPVFNGVTEEEFYTIKERRLG